MKKGSVLLLLLLCACGSKISYENRVQRHRAVASGKVFKPIYSKPVTSETFDPNNKCVKTEAADNCPIPD
jgi:hypothetical protein